MLNKMKKLLMKRNSLKKIQKQRNKSVFDTDILALFLHELDSSRGRAVHMKREGRDFESFFSPQLSVRLTEG